MNVELNQFWTYECQNWSIWGDECRTQSILGLWVSNLINLGPMSVELDQSCAYGYGSFNFLLVVLSIMIRLTKYQTSCNIWDLGRTMWVLGEDRIREKKWLGRLPKYISRPQQASQPSLPFTSLQFLVGWIKARTVMLWWYVLPSTKKVATLETMRGRLCKYSFA